MEPVEVDIEDKNIVGGIDRLVISFGLAVLAILPTLFVVTFTPWRAAPLLAGERPSGRDGYILGPGIFFVAAIVATSVLMTVLNPPDNEVPIVTAGVVETVENADDKPSTTRSMFRAGLEAGGRIAEEEETEDDAPGVGTRILAGVQSGNIWQAASSISPFFFWACFIAGISSAWGNLLRMPKWTLRAAMGGALYFATTYTVWISLPLGIIRYFVGDIDFEYLSGLIIILIVISFTVPLLALPWQTFWFVKEYTGETAHKSGLVTLSTISTLAVFFITSSLISAMVGLAATVDDAAPAEPAGITETLDDGTVAQDVSTPETSPED